MVAWSQETELVGAFWGDKNVLNLDCGGGYTSVYICQNNIRPYT